MHFEIFSYLNFISDSILKSEFNYNNYIAHYTSKDGLEKIIKSRTLFFTHYRYLNDKTEGERVLECLKFYIITNKQKDSNFINALKKLYNKLKYGYGREYNYLSNDYEFFVCCFSVNNDLDSMWRNYAGCNENNGGFNLIINRNNLENYLSDLSKQNVGTFTYEAYSTRVIYNYQEQQDILTTIIDKFYKFWNKTDNNCLLEILYEKFEEMKIKFKNNTYISEQEIRMVVVVKKECIQKMYSSNCYDVREKHGIKIPYLILNCINENVVDSITISPFSNYINNKFWLEQLLLDNNLERVAIEKSTCPSRW